ncbi:MAG: helix-turn-helix domain-containing protein [Acidobacteriota bacterium]
MSTADRPFGVQLKALRDAAGFTQEELATIAGLSVHAISALERGERKRPQFDTVRALSAALDLGPAARDAFLASARGYTGEATSRGPGRQALPVPPTRLIGREADLERLHQWVADPATRLVTLVGPGGVGKTRLAVALADALARDAAQRVLFVPLSAVHDAGLVAAAVAEAFGLDDATARDLPARVRAACHEVPTWVVLDNFEQVASAAPLVADLLTQIASLRILVTSRAPLHLRGEREYVVEPLGLDDLKTFRTPTDLAGVSAVELFVSRVQDVRSDFHLTPANSPVVAAICRRLDGLPLALELAAPWVKTLAPEGLLARLHEAEVLGAEGPSDLPPRQRTMNATVAWSVQLLAPLEQRAFRRLGAIPGPFSIAAAAAVFAGAATSVDGGDAALLFVRTLLNKSLLHRTKIPDTPDHSYVLLETVRAFAVRELAASGEHADAMAGLVRYCVAEGALAAPGLQGPRQVAWLDRVRDDLESHRAVLTWLLGQGRTEDASGLAWSLVLFWIMRGHSAEGLRWFDEVRQCAVPASVAEAQSLVGAALMRFTQGDMAGARVASSSVVRNAHADHDVLAHAWLCLGHVDYATGQLAAARDDFRRARALFHESGIAWGEGNSITGLAWVALGAGDATEAARFLDEADTFWPACGPWFRALGWYLRGVLALQAQDAQGALRLSRESLMGIRPFRDTFAIAYALVPLLCAAELIGDDEWVARIVGVRNGFTDRTGARAVDPLTDARCAHAEHGARTRLGPERWAAAYASGLRLSVDAVLDEIDAALGDAE